MQRTHDVINGVNRFACSDFDRFILLAFDLQCKHQQATGNRGQANQQRYQEFDQTAAGVGVGNHGRFAFMPKCKP
ncbi:hypothetical protein D3C80_1939600 [compost metagenome]